MTVGSGFGTGDGNWASDVKRANLGPSWGGEVTGYIMHQKGMRRDEIRVHKLHQVRAGSRNDGGSPPNVKRTRGWGSGDAFHGKGRGGGECCSLDV
jgi:hypothetical protein